MVLYYLFLDQSLELSIHHLRLLPSTTIENPNLVMFVSGGQQTAEKATEHYCSGRLLNLPFRI
jgi:hypothetical protein